MTHPPEASPAGTERLVFFSDAVIAIALTILVIELRATELSGSKPSELGGHLWEMRSRIAAFILSFLVIAIYWEAHHRLFHFVRRQDRVLVWLNFGFLFFIVLLPFPTALDAMFPTVPLATMLYLVTVVFIGLFKTAMWSYASRGGRLLAPEFNDPQLIRRETWWSLAAPICFIASIPLVLLSPIAGRAAWLLVAVIPIAAYLLEKRRSATLVGTL